MNLLELIAKNDPNVQVQVWDHASGTWTPHATPRSLFFKIIKSRLKFTRLRPRMAQDTVRGLLLRSGMRVVVRQAGKYWPNFARGEGVFKFCFTGVTQVKVVVGWSSDDHENLSAQIEFVANEKLVDVTVPPTSGDELDLVVLVPLQKGAKLFFGIHRVLDRNELYARCKGKGVEVGPGPKPQILPAARTRVNYVEQATPDQWQQLYGKDTKVPVNPVLWQLYVVGNADNIPADPGSLDFIFSSHVIEHLANPLGHLAYWAKLLRRGGVVAAVIPDRSGCKDYVFQSSPIEELDAEYRQGSMKPTLAHYQRWAKHRAPNIDPAEILKSGRSIHVHFYTPDSMADALRLMHKALGFRKYSVTSEANHKDFFVVLKK
ncbi:MAG: methyltransferase domain-containing protein [Burkholderiales bacterium]